MGTTGQMLITAGAVLSAGILLLTTYNRVYRWTLRQKAQDRELSAIRKENTLLTYGVLACLKGLEEQGCDGPVHEAIDKIERDLNLRAHDQEGNCGCNNRDGRGGGARQVSGPSKPWRRPRWRPLGRRLFCVRSPGMWWALLRCWRGCCPC